MKAVVNGHRSADWHDYALDAAGADEVPPRPEPADDITQLEPPPAEEDRPETIAAGRLLELDSFLALPTPTHEWLVPDLIEKQDRVIVTGREGGGKSTLLRQIAVQCASGVHPFDPAASFEPLRVLVLDLENSARHVSRKLRPLRDAAGEGYAGSLLLHVRPQGIDLLDPEDAAWLHATVDLARPDVVVTGPIYRLAGGDPTEEKTAKTVSAHLDRLRVRHGCAVVLEAHTPYGANGGKRPERPYGASLWSRWPEFGIYLDADTGALRHWRGARDERNWPHVLQRGGTWPWMPVERSRDVVWARVVEECVRVGGRPSLRDLEKKLSVPKSTLERVTKEHADEWAEFA